MQLTHHIKTSNYDEESKQVVCSVVRVAYKNVAEVTFYPHLNWQIVYWAESRTGPKAYAFNQYPFNENPSVIVFESAGEMNRFKEDLRLQEEANARASKGS